MMIDDTISRQAAIAACLKGKTEGLPATNVACDCCAERIRVLPPAEPKLKRGKWINDGGLYKCSYCNQLWAEWWAISKPIERMRKEMPYCPMCGSYNGEEN